MVISFEFLKFNPEQGVGWDSCFLVELWNTCNLNFLISPRRPSYVDPMMKKESQKLSDPSVDEASVGVLSFWAELQAQGTPLRIPAGLQHSRGEAECDNDRC